MTMRIGKISGTGNDGTVQVFSSGATFDNVEIFVPWGIRSMPKLGAKVLLGFVDNRPVALGFLGEGESLKEDSLAIESKQKLSGPLLEYLETLQKSLSELIQNLQSVTFEPGPSPLIPGLQAPKPPEELKL